MNVKDHNKLVKVVFDGSKHLNHVMTSKEIKKVTMIEGRYPVTRMPVCGHCEGLAYWHKEGNAYCPNCGTYTKSPITYSSYLASGFDLGLGGTAERMLKLEKRRKFLPDYGE